MKLIVFHFFKLFLCSITIILSKSFISAFLKKPICSKKNRICKMESSNPKEICCKGNRCVEYFGYLVCNEGLKQEGESCTSNEDCDSGKCDRDSIPAKCLNNPEKKDKKEPKKAEVKTDKQLRFHLCYYDEDCAFGKCIGSFRGVKFCN